MAEYDIALEHQIEWASFWTSDHGMELYHSLARAIAKKRAAAGELLSEEIINRRTEDFVIETAPLLHGECFYWSRDILDLVSVASQSLPDSWFLTKQHIPAISGFFWFAKPVSLGHEDLNIRAFGWTMIMIEDKVEAVYLPQHGSIPDFNAIALITFHENPGFPKPIPCLTHAYVGESLRDRKMKDVEDAASLNADVSVFALDYDSLRLFAAMVSFIQQRILVPVRYSASRAARRRVQATKRQTELEINVVKLRRVVHHAHKGEGEPVEWSCQWIVCGHWRDQWYPSLRRNQPLWIRPYLKGPEDKPLRNPNRLFAVVR